MLIPTKKQDPFATRRVTDAFPRDASRMLRFLFFITLPPISITRFKLGERVVGLPRILLMDVLLALYMIGMSVWFGEGESQRIAELLLAGIIWILVFTVFAVAQRIIRWVRRQRGERLTTWCMGLAQIGRRIPNGNAERYLEPLLLVGGGLYLLLGCEDALSLMAAPWLMVSGFALFATENYVHSLHLDRYDALLEADKHSALTEDHLRASGLSGPAQVVPTTPVATGIDKALAAAVRQRQNHRARQATEPPETPPLPSDPAAVPPQAIAPTNAVPAQPMAPPANTETAHDPLPATPSLLDALPPSVRQNLIPLAIGGVILAFMVISDLRSSKLLSTRRTDPDAAARDAAAAIIERAKQPAAPHAPLYPSAASAAVPNALPEAQSPQPAATESRPADPAKALTPDSLFLLGQRYETGDERPKDLAKAIEFYSYAAEQGSAFAMLRLGIAYEKGEGGLPQDERKAAEYISRASDKGHKTAKVLLADRYRLGKGVTKHALTAVSLYAEVPDDPSAMAGIADIIYDGDGPVEANPMTAVGLWKRAADKGHAGAQRALDALRELAKAGDRKVQTYLTFNGIPW